MNRLSDSFDVVCIGGAIIGSAAAYFLSESAGFDGSVLVVEPDWTYDKTSTTRAGNSIREQFSNPVNIQVSQFGMDFVANFEENTQVDGDAPELNFRGTGYLFLATESGMDVLRQKHEIQQHHGVQARLVDVAELAAMFPYMSVDGLAGASVGGMNEGSFDGWALLQGFRKRAIHNGVTYVKDRVVGVEKSGVRVTAVELESGRRVACAHVINSAGPRADAVARMVGLELPVEPRVRSTFVFDCHEPIDQVVPLTITPQGVHFRREQTHFVTGATPVSDPRADYDDLRVRGDEFEELIWPVLAERVPQFDRISVVTSWAGHYSVNLLDHNMVIGPTDSVENFYFANGFSGHGMQQSPAVGRGLSELIAYGEYRTIDMSSLGYDRILRNEPMLELAVI